ncbi:SET and MYND domain containing class 4 member 3 [Carabus blaptoides fortunei]
MNHFEQAAKLYSRGLIECPNTEDVLLATIFANRSAALYHMKEYHRSLEDMDLSLSLPYPKNLKYKIQDRRARCYLALNDLSHALEIFKKTMSALEESNLTAENRLKKEADVAVMIAMLTKTLSETKAQKKYPNVKSELPPVPNLSGNRNKKYPSASNLVHFTEAPGEGRFAVAERNIDPGEILVVEKAYCASLLYEQSKSHCQECFVRVRYPIPCPNCPNVVFCSIKCRMHALNTYHKYECKFLGSLWTSGCSIVCSLAIRLITQKGLQYFLDVKPNLSQNLNENTKYDPSSYKTIYNLCRHKDQRSHVDFFQRTVMATVLLRFLQETGFFKSEISKKLTDNEIYIGGLLLHNLQVLQFNAHEVAELQFDSDYPGELDRAKSQFIGGGLFPTLALFNHSCEPGIVRYFSGLKVIVRSVKSIESGNIIAENYGPIYTQTPKEVRKAELKTQYWFDCNCTPCTENWPLFDDMNTAILPFKCINGGCLGMVKVNTNTDEFMFPCPKCAESICIFGSLKSLNDTEALFNRGEKLLKNQLFKEALDVFIKIMKILDNVLKPPYKDFCLCQQKIRSLINNYGTGIDTDL